MSRSPEIRRSRTGSAVTRKRCNARTLRTRGATSAGSTRVRRCHIDWILGQHLQPYRARHYRSHPFSRRQPPYTLARVRRSILSRAISEKFGTPESTTRANGFVAGSPGIRTLPRRGESTRVKGSQMRLHGSAREREQWRVFR